MRGILGYRVFLIHKDGVKSFAAIKSFDELRTKFTAGFGSQWADMQILKANNMKVEGISTYESLFDMLGMKRFDYFPRGMNEAWVEIREKGKNYPNIVVDEHLALYYPFVVYFFVSKKNPALADRIRRGLEIALKDGSFKELFLVHHDIFIKQTHLDQRLLFKIPNPTLPPGTPEPDTSWWLKEKK